MFLLSANDPARLANDVLDRFSRLGEMITTTSAVPAGMDSGKDKSIVTKWSSGMVIFFLIVVIEAPLQKTTSTGIIAQKWSRRKCIVADDR